MTMQKAQKAETTTAITFISPVVEISLELLFSKHVFQSMPVVWPLDLNPNPTCKLPLWLPLLIGTIAVDLLRTSLDH